MLPLHQWTKGLMPKHVTRYANVWMGGFEPPTSPVREEHSAKLSYTQMNSSRGVYASLAPEPPWNGTRVLHSVLASAYTTWLSYASLSLMPVT